MRFALEDVTDDGSSSFLTFDPSTAVKRKSGYMEYCSLSPTLLFQSKSEQQLSHERKIIHDREKERVHSKIDKEEYEHD